MMSFPHTRFSMVWSACADAEYINKADAVRVFDFLRDLHEERFIAAVSTCSFCENEHGQCGAPYIGSTLAEQTNNKV